MLILTNMYLDQEQNQNLCNSQNRLTYLHKKYPFFMQNIKLIYIFCPDDALSVVFGGDANFQLSTEKFTSWREIG